MNIVIGLMVALILGLGTFGIVQTNKLSAAELAAAKSSEALAKERTTAAKAYAALQDKYRKVESDLQTQAIESKEEKNELIQDASVRRNDLINRLRLAEARIKEQRRVHVSSNPKDPKDGAITLRDSEQELPQRIGAEDVAEAERAEVIRASLLSCYRDYETVRLKLESLQ